MSEEVRGSWMLDKPKYKPLAKHWEITHWPSGQIFAPELMHRASEEHALLFLDILSLSDLGPLCDRDMDIYGYLEDEALSLYYETEAACESLL